MKNLINLKRVFRYIRPYIKLEAFIFFLTLISTLFSLVLPYFMKILIDNVIIGKQIFLFKKIIFALLGILVLQSVLSLLLAYVTAKLTRAIVFSTSKEVYDHLLKLPLNFFSKNPAGDTISRLNNDIGALQTTAQKFFFNFLFNFLSIIIIITILFHLNWKLSILSLITIPLYLLNLKFFRRKLYTESKSIQETIAKKTKILHETIGGIKTIKIFAKEMLFSNKYKNNFKNLVDFEFKRTIRRNIASEISRIYTYIGPLIVLFYGGWLSFRGILSIGSLIAFYTYLLKLYNPINGLINSQLNLSVASAGINRIFEFIDSATEHNYREGKKLPNIKGVVKFNNVSFAYEDRDFFISDISFTANPGNWLGIIGPSGSGKTTLANLLCKYYKPLRGEITIDENCIEDISTLFLRQNISVITQDPFFFNDTIMNNLLFAKENAALKEMEEACKAAHIFDFIMSLPKKYDTRIGERGFEISDGQKQRFSIARTILKNPKILILDEATSAMDSITERKVMDEIFNIFKSNTAIIIAHRLSNLRYVKKIMVIDKGKIVEKGDNPTAMIKKGAFRKYLAFQVDNILKEKRV